MAVAWRESEKRMPCVGIRLAVLKKACAVASSSAAMSNLGSLPLPSMREWGLMGRLNSRHSCSSHYPNSPSGARRDERRIMPS